MRGAQFQVLRSDRGAAARFEAVEGSGLGFGERRCDGRSMRACQEYDESMQGKAGAGRGGRGSMTEEDGGE